MFPWLAHGHITPFLELSKNLLKTNYFTVYLCSTAVNLDAIRPGLPDASVQLVELHMPSSPQLPPHLHTTKNLPNHLLPALIRAFQESSSSFTDIVDSVKPHLLIYDYFEPWAPKIASSRGIPSVLFSTSGATSLSFFHHVFTKGSASTFPFPAINLPDEEMARLVSRIVPNVKEADDGFAGAVARSTEVVLVKSCLDFEGKYLDFLSVSCKKRMLCTGPLIASNANEHDEFENSEIVKWLDEKDLASTIYISFGSECFLSKNQIGEIAKGLKLCDANFLWVVRFPIEETGTGARLIKEELPAGFIESVAGRGLVVPRWAPQTRILGHPSVGGFVSHCGWSSVMESVYYGVPIVAMPMKSEQPLNAQVVVEAGVGVEVGKDGDGHYVGEEVVKGVEKVMAEKAFRDRARRLGEAIKEKEEEVVREVGEELLEICVKNKKEV